MTCNKISWLVSNLFLNLTYQHSNFQTYCVMVLKYNTAVNQFQNLIIYTVKNVLEHARKRHILGILALHKKREGKKQSWHWTQKKRREKKEPDLWQSKEKKQKLLPYCRYHCYCYQLWRLWHWNWLRWEIHGVLKSFPQVKCCHSPCPYEQISMILLIFYKNEKYFYICMCVSFLYFFPLKIYVAVYQ